MNYGDEDQEEVADGETHDEHVRLGPHPFVGQYREGQRRVSGESDNVDKDEENDNDDPHSVFGDLAFGVRFRARIRKHYTGVAAAGITRPQHNKVLNSARLVERGENAFCVWNSFF